MDSVVGVGSAHEEGAIGVLPVECLHAMEKDAWKNKEMMIYQRQLSWQQKHNQWLGQDIDIRDSYEDNQEKHMGEI